MNNAVFQIGLLRALLENDAKEAREIMANFTPVFASIYEYLAHKRSLAMDKYTVTHNEDGTVTLDYQS